MNDFVAPQQAGILGGSPYRSNKGLSIAIIVLLSVHAALSAILVAAWPSVTNLLREDGLGSDPGLWEAMAGIAVGIAAILQWGIFIATAACFLTWLYRAYANLPSLGSESIIFSPKSAVVGWFIPFVNLVQGYKSVNTLYVESQPRSSPSGFRVPSSAPIVALWWFTYLARGVTSRIADKMLNHSSDGAIGWLVTAELFDIVAAILCIMIVYRIERRQRDQHSDLLLRATAAVPPPADQLR